VPSSAKTFDRFLVLLAVLGVLTVGLALVAALRAPAEGSDGVGTAAAGAGDQGPQAVTATIELSEWAIEGDLTIPAGDVTIELANVGAMVHNLAFEDGKVSQDVNPGETDAFHVGELEAVVARCLEKDVRKRYQNVAELAVALYPFAPRRARISAERCSYLLGSTPNGGALDLSSVAPPPGTEEIGARTGRSNTAPSVTFSELSAMQRGKRMKLLLAATAALNLVRRQLLRGARR